MQHNIETDGNRIDFSVNHTVKIFLFCSVCGMGLEVATCDTREKDSLEVAPCSRCIYDAKQEALSEQ